MTSIELLLCDIQGRLFKLSAQRGINSAEFIKVLMKSATAKALDSTYNRMQWAGEEYLLEEIIEILRALFGGTDILDRVYLSVLALCGG